MLRASASLVFAALLLAACGDDGASDGEGEGVEVGRAQVALAALWAGGHGVARADIYECRRPDGSTHYTNAPSGERNCRVVVHGSDRPRAAASDRPAMEGAEAFSRIVDRSIQMCGGLGVSADLPLARLADELRPFRIYDGPSEVHRWAIAKRAVGRARKAAQRKADHA